MSLQIFYETKRHKKVEMGTDRFLFFSRETENAMLAARIENEILIAVTHGDWLVGELLRHRDSDSSYDMSLDLLWIHDTKICLCRAILVIKKDDLDCIIRDGCHCLVSI